MVRERQLWNGRDHREVWSLAEARCRGLGTTMRDYAQSGQAMMIRQARKVPAEYSAGQVERCARYMFSDPWKREAGISIPWLIRMLPEWVAMGEPETVGQARFNRAGERSLSIDELGQMTEQLEAAEGRH